MAALDLDALKGRAQKVLAGFSPSQLVIIGLLTVVAVTGATAFLRWVTAPTYGVLLAGLDPKDAAAVTAKLDADGVPYQLEGGGSTVLVRSDQLDAQRLAVASAGLPAGKTDSGWATFDKGGLTTSSFQQQVAYQRALEQTLAQSLQGISGVRSAQVHLALPEKKLFTEQKEAARASVLLETSADLDDETVDAMTHLVASAVPGLAPSDVSLTDSGGRLLTGDGSTAGGAGRAAKERQAYEDVLSARVTTMFDQLLGPGRAVVRVSAEIDSANRTIDSETFDKDRTAVLSEAASEETYETAPTDALAQGTLTQNPDETGDEKANDYRKSQRTTTNGVSRTVERQVLAPGGVKRLTVAVAVDRNTGNLPTAAELQALAANAVGLDPGRGDTIAVTTPAFPQPVEETPPAEDEGTSPVATVGTYAGKVLGGLLLLLVGLGFLRTVRRGTSTEVSAEQLTAALQGAGGRRADELPELEGEEVPALPAGSSARYDDGQLLELLDENPDEVAGLLRGWLTTTGAER